jgi:hypothetical protein
MMRNAQGGAAFDNMARQFGLSPQDTQRAVEALLPAFVMGLQRSATNPNAFANLMSLVGSGRPTGFFDHPNLAFSPQAQSQGNDFLGQLFRRSGASRRIADQAAAWSGVGAAAVQQMMPAVAAMLMGGMAKTASQPPPPEPQSPFEAWSGVMRQMLGVEPKPAPEPANPWLDMMQKMTGQKPAEPAPTPPPAPHSRCGASCSRPARCRRAARRQPAEHPGHRLGNGPETRLTPDPTRSLTPALSRATVREAR